MGTEPEWNEIQPWLKKSSKLFIKKLARNDSSWADGARHGHQAGLYVPREVQKAGFFPVLANSNSAKPHILDARFATFWPATGEVKSSSLKHYTNKGAEMHFTRLPRDEFKGLTPASWLVGGVLKEPIRGASYWFMVIDSELSAAETLEATFDLDSTFHFDVFDPALLPQDSESDALGLIDDIKRAMHDGVLPEFLARVSSLPTPEAIAAEAQSAFLAGTRFPSLSPFDIPEPGDAIMRISRDIEYRLYKRAEMRARATQVVQMLSGAGADLVTSVVQNYGNLSASFLSASQQRRSRAGLSFETHVAAMLFAGRIRFEAQAVTGGRRPDFVLPGIKELNKGGARAFDAALILSLKTTLRERWKQVSRERHNCAVFLATVDDRVTSEAIGDMGKEGICLIVPESLKSSNETCYAQNTNVISFRTFFDDEVASRRPFLILPTVSN